MPASGADRPDFSDSSTAEVSPEPGSSDWIVSPIEPIVCEQAPECAEQAEEDQQADEVARHVAAFVEAVGDGIQHGAHRVCRQRHRGGAAEQRLHRAPAAPARSSPSRRGRSSPSALRETAGRPGRRPAGCRPASTPTIRPLRPGLVAKAELIWRVRITAMKATMARKISMDSRNTCGLASLYGSYPSAVSLLLNFFKNDIRAPNPWPPFPCAGL